MNAPSHPRPHPPKTPKKAALASWIGSALEYYDFFIYGTAAALEFIKVFFPSSSHAARTLMALGNFGVGYVARPLGAFLLGHVGDKYGRKRVLVFTLLLMGASTFLVGCLPTYKQIGVWAPALLVVLRLMQGLSASGEQAGGNSMTLEHAPEHRRAFFTSFTMGGTQFGQVLATTAFLPIATLPNDQLMSWGWRVPFWLSGLVVIAGLIIRRKVDETPAFQEEAAERATAKMPLAVLFRDHLGDVLRVVLGALASTVSTIFSVYALSFAVNTAGFSKTPMLWVSILANLSALAALPLWALLADRIGRKPVFIFGSLGSAALMFAYLSAIGNHNLPMVFVMGVAMSGIVYSAQNGIFPAFFGEMVPPRVRLSGTAIGTQIGFALGGFAPTFASAIAGPGPGGWLPVAVLTLGASLLAAIAAMTARETHKIPLHELDEVQQPKATVAATA